MSEERQLHPEEPAEGAEEDTGAPGADKASERGTAGGSGAEEGAAVHPQEPAEGSDDSEEAPGFDRPSSND